MTCIAEAFNSGVKGPFHIITDPCNTKHGVIYLPDDLELAPRS